ncbi:MAG TPA: hypothetical protein VGM90_37110 [Kofleriaceae bacterium]|jgi:hypothetical protein
MNTRVLLSASLALGLLGVAAGCEKTNDESIEKWRRTEKGPGKLKATLHNSSIDPALSAHAAAVMIDMGQDGPVRTEFDEMAAERRILVLQKLAPRLWDSARVQREDALPVGPQIVAKDQLFALRKYADAPLKAQIDGYLLDWYGVVSYEARAKTGAVLGSTAMRAIGPAGGKKLVTVLNGVVTAPGQTETKKNRIGDELMLGIAASGDPDGVKRLLEVAHLDLADPTLSRRALDALRQAYVDPGGLFDMQDNAPLKPNLGALLDVARDDKMAGQPADMAIELIRRIGPPDCQEALVGLIGMPHPSIKFRYATAQSALICGGAKAVLPVIEAFPEGAYMKDELVGAVVSEIAKQSRAETLTALRQALGEKSVIGRWMAIESLARMKSTEDQSKIAALSSSKEKLVGYWGDQSGGTVKPDPTLGDRAKELADLVGKGEVPK